MKPRGAPTHLLFEMALDAIIEQRKHDAEDAGVGVEAANGDSPDSSALELADIRSRQTVLPSLFEHEIILLRLKQ